MAESAKKDQVHVQVEQVGHRPEDPPLDRLGRLQEEVHRPVELVHLLSLVVPVAVFLIPLTRFPGFVWMIATGFNLPRREQLAA